MFWLPKILPVTETLKDRLQVVEFCEWNLCLKNLLLKLSIATWHKDEYDEYSKETSLNFNMFWLLNDDYQSDYMMPQSFRTLTKMNSQFYTTYSVFLSSLASAVSAQFNFDFYEEYWICELIFEYFVCESTLWFY